MSNLRNLNVIFPNSKMKLLFSDTSILLFQEHYITSQEHLIFLPIILRHMKVTLD